MRTQRVDPDLPIGKLTRVTDVLPPPERLVIPGETVKVTLRLSKPSVEFFKHQAARHRTPYQRMIREVVDRYATRYS